MAKYHIKPDGNPGKCRASLKGCPFVEAGGVSNEHYDSKRDARVAYEAIQEKASQAPAPKTIEELDGAPEQRFTQLVDDRSAGRWCEKCRQHGSHHTDRHDEMTAPMDPLETKAVVVFKAMATSEAKAQWASEETNSYWWRHGKIVAQHEKGELSDKDFASMVYMGAAGERAGQSRKLRDAAAASVAKRHMAAMRAEYNLEISGTNVGSEVVDPFSTGMKELIPNESKTLEEYDNIMKDAKSKLDQLKPLTDFYDAQFMGSEDDRKKILDRLLED